METPLVLIIIIITIFSIVVSGLFFKQTITPKNNKYAQIYPAELIHTPEEYMRRMFEQSSYGKIMYNTEDMLSNTLKQLFNAIKIVNKNVIDQELKLTDNIILIENSISYMFNIVKLLSI
jgi:hypothetical protein